MSAQAAINRIIPLSVVDGPGNRTSVFLQGCNIACAYCHNPETQRMCCACGSCVSTCPVGALTLVSEGGRRNIVWDEGKCCGCDTCIAGCPHFSSPKVRMMDAEEVFAQVRSNVPFIRGITVSGGECMLRTDFLTELFTLCKGIGLSTLIDSNGTIDFSLYPALMEVCDGVMLDVKSWKEETFRSLTGHGNTIVRKNLTFLADAGKLEEMRIVCLEGEVDADDAIRGIADSIPEHISSIPLKLIRFRKYGVRGRLEGMASPGEDIMNSLFDLAVSLGFGKVVIR